MEYKNTSDLHITRKIWHASAICLYAFIYYQLSFSAAFQAALLSVIFCLGIDTFRLNFPKVNTYVMAILKPVTRSHEVNSYAGTSYFSVGALAIILIFPKNIVLLSLILLAFADPIASAVGIIYGKEKIYKKKTLQGSFAALLASATIACIYFLVTQTMNERLFIVSMLTGFIGALSELFTPFDIDDNFSFPILSSASLYGLFYIFGGL